MSGKPITGLIDRRHLVIAFWTVLVAANSLSICFAAWSGRWPSKNFWKSEPYWILGSVAVFCAAWLWRSWARRTGRLTPPGAGRFGVSLDPS